MGVVVPQLDKQQLVKRVIKQVWVIGASGYSGIELCRIIMRHAHLQLHTAFANSDASCGAATELYPQYQELEPLELVQWDDNWLAQASAIDIVFLALPHAVSLELAPKLLQKGCVVVDLSAAFRLTNVGNYPQYYGFEHSSARLLAQRYYAFPHAFPHAAPHALPTALHALVNATSALPTSNLLSMPGCYPTAASLALAPLVNSEYFLTEQMPVVTAVSGVSGAGRQATLATSFCEVSLRPYAVLEHRHQCEIAQNLGCDVMFVPQLGNFKRGIVATCAVRVRQGTTQAQLDALFAAAYAGDESVRIRQRPPQVDDVAMTPYGDLYVRVQGDKVVVIAAIDNLLKGAASQAIEACNLKFGWPRMAGLQ